VLGLHPDGKFTTAPAVPLAPGDTVLLLTDGVEEALSPNDEIFGADRALNCLRENASLSAREMVERLYDTVRDFEQHAPQNDDITMVVIRVF
jgi:phosphoserine phosphatase RsbU/P